MTGRCPVCHAPIIAASSTRYGTPVLLNPRPRPPMPGDFVLLRGQHHGKAAMLHGQALARTARAGRPAHPPHACPPA